MSVYVTVAGAAAEARAWRDYYTPGTYSFGAGLMSEAYLHEMIHGTDEQYTDDSDNDTIALERALQTVAIAMQMIDLLLSLFVTVWHCCTGSPNP